MAGSRGQEEEGEGDGEVHEGTIKSFEEAKGYGFIRSTTVFDKYGVDAFLHRRQLRSFIVGDQVRFSVRANQKGQPQAYDLSSAVAPLADSAAPAATATTEASQASASSMAAAQLRGGGSSMQAAAAKAQSRRPPKRYEGTIKFFDDSKGCGFITVRGQPDVYLSRKEIFGFAPGDRVSFHVRQSNLPNVPDRLVAFDLMGSEAPDEEEGGAVASQATPLINAEGTIKSFDPVKGYGFIACQQAQELWGGGDVYLHKTQINGFQPGARVRFVVRINEKTGKPQAQDVRAAGADSIDGAADAAVGSGGEAAGARDTPARDDSAAPASASDNPGEAETPSAGGGAQPKSRWARSRRRRLQDEELPSIYQGTLRKIDSKTGYGFIRCQELYDQYRRDVFVGRKHLGSFEVGDLVRFRVQARGSRLKAVGLHPGENNEPTMIGTIKSFDANRGFGFITCPEAFEKYERDVFVHTKQIKNFQIGDPVSFSIRINAQGQPQAYCLQEAPETAGWLAAEGAPGAPAEQQIDSEEEFEGEIKSFSRNDGYGFIECPKLFERFERDVYLEKSELNGVGIRDRVRFRVKVRRGHPRARDVVLISASSKGAANKGAGDLSNLDPSVLDRKLVRACASAKVESVDDMEQLLEAGADPCARDVTGQTALMVAALNVRHSERKLRMLMHYGADPTMTALPEEEVGENDDAQTILQWMRERINPNMAQYLEALHLGEDPDCDTALDGPDEDL